MGLQRTPSSPFPPLVIIGGDGDSPNAPPSPPKNASEALWEGDITIPMVNVTISKMIAAAAVVVLLLLLGLGSWAFLRMRR